MSDTMNAFSYKCPNCAAELKFSADAQAFCCEFCLSTFSEEEMREIAKKKAEQQASLPQSEVDAAEQFANETGVYLCESCGAEVMADDNTAATFCFYCHNPVILKGRVSGDYKPSSVLPFQVSREKALDIFRNYCKSKWFLPSDFFSTAQQEKIVGLYVPFWVADCDVNGKMEAHATKVRSWSDSRYNYTETKDYAIARDANVVLHGIPADGASHIDDELMESAEPFDYSQARPFEMQYLSGFLAEKYDVDTASVFPRVQKRAVQGSDQMLRSSIQGYTAFSVTNSEFKVLKTDWKYMLLPIWFMSYKYQDKVYEFAVNGQTGKFVGTAPISKQKQTLVSGGIGLGIALLIGLVVFLL